MIKDIKRKIAQAVERRIASEEQVVYILVQVRKILDADPPPGDYYALKFYCDWAVHAMLDQKGAQTIVRRFDAQQRLMDDMFIAKHGDVLTPTPQELMEELVKTLQLSKFRTQLESFLDASGIDSSLTRDKSRWTEFLIQYTGVIEDCPLRCLADPPLERIDEVSVTVVHTPERPVVPGRTYDFELVIQWNWKSKITNQQYANQQFFFSE
jgi:hypothetical protein